MAGSAQPEHISITEFAMRMGVARGAVDAAIKRGRITLIPRAERGKGGYSIPWPGAREQWIVNTDPSAAADNGKVYGADADDGESTPVAVTFQKARTDREQANASMAQLELAERLGELGRIAAVREAAYDVAHIARYRVMQIADRLAPILAAETDLLRIHTMLSDELREALDGVAERIAQRAQRKAGVELESGP